MTNDKTKLKSLNLKTVNLEGIRYTYNSLSEQDKKLNDIDQKSIHYTKISIYTILLYMFLSFLILAFACYKFYIQLGIKDNKVQTEEPSNQNQAQVSTRTLQIP